LLPAQPAPTTSCPVAIFCRPLALSQLLLQPAPLLLVLGGVQMGRATSEAWRAVLRPRGSIPVGSRECRRWIDFGAVQERGPSLIYRSSRARTFISIVQWRASLRQACAASSSERHDSDLACNRQSSQSAPPPLSAGSIGQPRWAQPGSTVGSEGRTAGALTSLARRRQACVARCSMSRN
jgi:hypothetical protein